MRVTPRSVHNKCARILADGLGKSFRSFFNDDVTPTSFTGESSVEGRTIRIIAVLERGDDNLLLEARFTLYKPMR